MDTILLAFVCFQTLYHVSVVKSSSNILSQNDIYTDQVLPQNLSEGYDFDTMRCYNKEVAWCQDCALLELSRNPL